MDPRTIVVNERYEVEVDRVVQTPLTEDHRAHDLMLDRPVVFKTLADELVTDRAFVDRFRRHVQAAANLTHPNITAVYDWGRDRGGVGDRPGPTYYVIAERLNGRTVAGYVDTKGPLPTERAVHVLLGVTAAVAYAHGNGTLHGGLRPEVVSVTPNGLVKVSDFGFELALGLDWTPLEDHPEDAMWRAPELVRAEQADERTDVYGIGQLLYLLTTGRPPFVGTSASAVSRAQLETVPPAPSKLNPNIPRALEVIIGRCMAKRREDRFATVADIRAALVRYRDSLAAGSPPAPPSSPAAGSPAASTPSSGSAAANLRSGAAAVAAPSSVPSPVAPAPAAATPPVTPPVTPAVPAAPSSPPAAAVDVDATQFVSGTMPSRQDRPPTFAVETPAGSTTNDDATVMVERPVLGGPGDATGDQGRGSDDATTVITTGRTRRPPRDRSQGPRLWPLVAVFAVLLGVLIGLGWLLISSLNLTGGGGKTVAVPSVIGQSSANAESALSNAGLAASVESVTNPSIAPDVVFDQSPPAGEQVKDGATVKLKVSAGAGTPRVPDVVGQTLDAARAVLASSGLGVDVTEREDGTAAPGTVLEQDPKPDAELTSTLTKVKLVVSLSTGKVPVPDVAGKTQDEASKAMIEAGFRFVVQGEPSATVEKNKVTRSEPAAGTQVDKGGSVTVFVSKGAAIDVPSVFGQTEANALQTLTAAGFTVDRRTKPVRDVTDIGVVIDQTPTAGTAAAPGAAVSVVIGVADPSTPTSRAPRATTTVPTSAVGEERPVSTVPRPTEPVTTPAEPVTPAPTQATPAPTVAAVPATAPPATPAPVPVASTTPA